MQFAEEMRELSRSLTLGGVIVLMPGEIDTPIIAQQNAVPGTRFAQHPSMAAEA